MMVSRLGWNRFEMCIPKLFQSRNPFERMIFLWVVLHLHFAHTSRPRIYSVLAKSNSMRCRSLRIAPAPMPRWQMPLCSYNPIMTSQKRLAQAGTRLIEGKYSNGTCTNPWFFTALWNRPCARVFRSPCQRHSYTRIAGIQRLPLAYIQRAYPAFLIWS